MNINKILKEAKRVEGELLLLESGIKLPKDTKAVSLTFHNDLDGFFSALVSRDQLIKQGIPLRNIKFNSIQYDAGDEGLLKKMNVKRGQASVLVDFAGIEKDTKVQLKDKDDRDLKYKEGAEVESPKGWVFKMNNGKVIATKGDKKAVLKRYGKDGKYIDGEKVNVDANLRIPDFWSDHHVAREESLEFMGKGKEKKTAGNIGKTEYKSDTEHIAKVNTVNMMDGKDIEAVTKIDSAQYDDLMQTLTLPKNFKEKGRLDRLAIILNSLLSQILKKNPTAIKEMLKDPNTKASVVSVYNQSMKYAKLNNKQVDALEELKKESPDWNKIDSIRNELPKSMAKETTKEVATGKKRRTSYKDVSDERNASRGKIKSREEMAKKGEEDLEKATKKYWTGAKERELEALQKRLKELGEAIEDMTKEEILKRIEELKKEKKESISKFQSVGDNVIRQDAKSTRDYPGRFTGSVLTKKGSKERYPFQIKRFSGMIQVSANPDLPDEQKKEMKVALVDDMQDILDRIERKHKTRQNSWAWEKIKNKSGGHQSITNITGLNMLGLMPKKERTELKNLEEFLGRSKLPAAQKENKYPEKYARLQELKNMKEESAKERETIMNDIEMEFYKILNNKYKGAKVSKEISNQEKTIKEEAILKILSEMKYGKKKKCKKKKGKKINK